MRKKTKHRIKRAIKACYRIEIVDVVRADDKALIALIMATGFLTNLASAERVDRAGYLEVQP